MQKFGRRVLEPVTKTFYAESVGQLSSRCHRAGRCSARRSERNSNRETNLGQPIPFSLVKATQDMSNHLPQPSDIQSRQYRLPNHFGNSNPLDIQMQSRGHFYIVWVVEFCWSCFWRSDGIDGGNGSDSVGLMGREGSVDAANKSVEELMRSRFASSVRRSNGEARIVGEEIRF